MEAVVGRDFRDKNKIVNMRRIGDRILSINQTLEKENVHIINIFAPEVGLNKENKWQFRDIR